MAGYTEHEYERMQADEVLNPAKGTQEWAERIGQGEGSEGSLPGFNQNADNASGATAGRHSQSASAGRENPYADDLAGTDRQIKTITDWMDAEENRPETAEERKKRERRERSKKIVAAVSDGLSALSNLYYTSRYAPNMYNHEKGSQMRTVDARTERLKRERERNADRYMNMSLKLGDLENQGARTIRELEAQHEAQKMAREKANREAELHPLNIAIREAQERKENSLSDKAGWDAEAARVKAEWEPRQQQADLETEHARRGSLEASAANSRASAAASRARAGSYGKTKHHFMGKEYESVVDYEKDVTEAARSYNRRHSVEVEEKDEKTGKTIKKLVPEEGYTFIVMDDTVGDNGDRRKRAPQEYAGEVERRLKEEAADNVPPSRRQNNNTPPSRR